jgi:hypothetical protein
MIYELNFFKMNMDTPSNANTILHNVYANLTDNFWETNKMFIINENKGIYNR